MTALHALDDQLHGVSTDPYDSAQRWLPDVVQCASHLRPRKTLVADLAEVRLFLQANKSTHANVANFLPVETDLSM